MYIESAPKFQQGGKRIVHISAVDLGWLFEKKSYLL